MSVENSAKFNGHIKPTFQMYKFIIIGLLRVLGLLLRLDGADDAPRRSARANDVLVRDGEQVALLHGELHVKLRDVAHVFNHFFVAFCLLAELRHVAGTRPAQQRFRYLAGDIAIKARVGVRFECLPLLAT